MAKLALVCPPLPGHLNPIAVLGRVLRSRGHSVSVFQIPALEQPVRAQGLDFHPVGTAGSNSLKERIAQMTELEGLSSLRFAVESSRQIADLLCLELPSAFQSAGIELALVDQNEPAAGSVAEHLGLPFINVCPSLPLNREPAIPPPFVPWPYSSSPGAGLRNWLGYRATDRLIAPINSTINKYRREWGLPPLRQPDDSFSRAAQLCQMTADFDFPRTRLPGSFHYLGPFVNSVPEPTPFPFEKLDGRPLIFASLGTLQAKNNHLFGLIAEACSGLNAQLVIALGDSSRETSSQTFAGDPIVVGYAPQVRVLARASLTITHAGLNTVMQSLLFGVPIVALPITHDQPAIAARVARSGAGKAIPASKVTVPLLRNLVEMVLTGPQYRNRAQELALSARTAGGVERAADIVETVLASHSTPSYALRNH